MYAVECYGGDYSDKWSRVVGFCSTETRAQEYIAEKEERYARKLKFSEIINNMISDWQIKNPDHRQFYEHFKQSIPIPKWNSKNGQMTPEFRAERNRIQEENAKMAEEYYENLHSRKEIFYASLVDEINKAFIEHGLTPEDFGLDVITCDNIFVSVDEENYTYYEIKSLD